MSPSARVRRSTVSAVLAAVILLATYYVGFFGAGKVPPLGQSFNPVRGVWTMAGNARLPGSATINLPGLDGIVTVSFDSRGVPSINATTEHDLFEAEGYLQAHFRLFQMDVERREAEGLLSQILGPAALSTDQLELTLGLARTAKAEWSHIGATSALGRDLAAYSQGINYQIGRFEAGGNLPAQFKLLKYRPARWSPLDTLAIQGEMTQLLDFTTTPISYSLAIHSLGYTTAMKLLPIIPANQPAPYDPGPYTRAKLAPITRSVPGALLISATGQAAQARSAHRSASAPAWTPSASVGSIEKADASILRLAASAPANLTRLGGDSNNWAVDSTRTVSGKAILAGDPHLGETLPAIWYELSASSPQLYFSGFSIPGVPGILIGHNRSIAWSLTDTQNQSAFYYQEKTSPSRPGEYFYKGKWRRFNSVTYSIPVRGQGTRSYKVLFSVHGPLLTQSGKTVSMYWTGAIPSDDLLAMMNVMRASNFAQFKQALSVWLAPTQNFAFADTAGDIGIIAPGIYPQFPKGARPWTIMSGTGVADPIGTIPESAVPQAYDPPTHYVFSANQREVSAQYPYYIGTSANFFDYGYRARTISSYLATHPKVSVAQMEALQQSNVDLLATEIVPLVLSATRGASPAAGVAAESTAAVAALQGWNYEMTTNSAAAGIWWTFLENYLKDTFGPLWKARKVPTGLDPALAIGTGNTALVEDIEAASLSSTGGGIFSTPITQGLSRDAIIREAFGQAVAQLAKRYGPKVSGWTWGRMHKRQYVSLTFVKALGYGPFPGAGDRWTVDAADGGMTSTAGPSERFVAELGSQYIAVYPGGQSENPISPWYEDQIPAWLAGRYYSMATPKASAALAVWTLR